MEVDGGKDIQIIIESQPLTGASGTRFNIGITQVRQIKRDKGREAKE